MFSGLTIRPVDTGFSDWLQKACRRESAPTTRFGCNICTSAVATGIGWLHTEVGTKRDDQFSMFPRGRETSQMSSSLLIPQPITSRRFSAVTSVWKQPKRTLRNVFGSVKAPSGGCRMGRLHSLPSWACMYTLPFSLEMRKSKSLVPWTKRPSSGQSTSST